MDVMLNNGTLAMNVTPDELKRLDELGYLSKNVQSGSCFPVDGIRLPNVPGDGLSEPKYDPSKGLTSYGSTHSADERLNESEQYTGMKLSSYDF